MKRNKMDVRLQSNVIYTERHHVIPRHSGGSDNPHNLVELLPEEHLLAHLLRYKAYNSNNDFIAARFIINGYMNKANILDVDISVFTNKSLLKCIGLYKNMIVEYRKIHGWQTDDGRKRISDARKGKFPCVDAKTGESVGSHDRNHPNILSGMWVHHSKGKASVIDIHTGEKLYLPVSQISQNKTQYIYSAKTDQAGTKNNNFKPLTTDMKKRVFNCVSHSIMDERYFSVNQFSELIKKEFTEFKKISVAWIKNRFGSFDAMLNEYNSQNNTDIQYIPYYRSTAQREKLKNISSQQCWITDGTELRRILKSDLENQLKLNPAFRRGKTIKKEI